MRNDIIKTVLTDGEYYFRNRTCIYASLTRDPLKAWDFNNWLCDIRTKHCNFLKLDLEQFVYVAKKQMKGDRYEDLGLDYTKFKLKHIISLSPLKFEDFDATNEVGIIKEYGSE
jgi:hypothetical protein